MKLVGAFYDAKGRPRSGWRFAIFVFLFTLAAMVLGAASLALVSAMGAVPAGGTAAFLVVNSTLSLLTALVIGWFCGWYLERIPFAALGAGFEKGWIRNVAVGIVLGAASFSIAVAIGWLAGGLSFVANASASTEEIVRTLVMTFLIFALAAAFEEALFRGYILQTFVRSDLTLFGILLTSTLFATVHNANPNATVLSWLNTLIAGIWFGIAYLKTRDLWFPTALHLSWNWSQGSIFGVEVSGLRELVPAPLLRERDFGPAWLTGGDYGVEGGVITTVALILSLAAVALLPLRSRAEIADRNVSVP